MKPLVVQRRAMRDLEAARAWYASHAPHAAPAFADAVDQGLLHLREHPATGSPRYGQQLGMHGLRSWALTRHPYTVLYFEHADRITVVRVLHQSRDIPAHPQR